MNPLRRVSDQLREMRWTQVLVELLLLVLGILIALAVDDWVQSRRDARMERDYLQLLVRDYEVLVGKVWQRTSVSFQAINNVKVAANQAAEVRQAINAELAARWRE